SASRARNISMITGRNYIGSDFPDPSDTAGDSLLSADNHPPAGPDNLLNPTNDVDLGSTKSNTTVNFVGGTHPIGTWTLHIDPSAALGTYTIQTITSSYGATGTNGGTHDNVPFDNNASINVVLSAVP